MVITFKDRKFGELVNNERNLTKKLGEAQADKLLIRLNQMRDANTLEDVRNLAGKYHELKYDRKCQWGCDLNQPYRLIFQPHEDPIPINESGQYLWDKITGVEIVEIINYHKEK
jgi:proteic killer suppression protein